MSLFHPHDWPHTLSATSPDEKVHCPVGFRQKSTQGGNAKCET